MVAFKCDLWREDRDHKAWSRHSSPLHSWWQLRSVVEDRGRDYGPSPRGSNGFKIHQKGEGLDVLEGEASLCVPSLKFCQAPRHANCYLNFLPNRHWSWNLLRSPGSCHYPFTASKARMCAASNDWQTREIISHFFFSGNFQTVRYE